MNEITVRVPATSANLGAGFDTLGLALGLYNRVTIGHRVLDSRVQIGGEGADVLSCDESNLAYSSAQKLFDFLGIECDFALRMHNEIPLSRGLGSSAAACVGGLFAANVFAKSQFDASASRDELLHLAAQIEGHPDNSSACLLGGLVVSAQNQTQTFAVQVNMKNAPCFAVWIPDEPLPTKAARAVVPTQISREDAIFNISRAALLVAAISSGDERALTEALHDKMHQTQRAPLIRSYHEVTQAAAENGAIGTTLSGAGSTILLWCNRESSTRYAVESAVTQRTRDHDFAGRFLWLDVDESGAQAVQSEP